MTIQLTKPEIKALIATLLQSGKFKDAEDVSLQAVQSSVAEPSEPTAQRDEVIECLRTFGKEHGLSLGGMAISELRREARP